MQDPVRDPKWLTLFAMCLGLGMLMIDTFVVNVALPTIASDLDAGLAATEWVVTGYLLAIAVLPVAMGRLGDLFGRRRVYTIGLGIFVAASAAAGLAPNIETLIALRVVQGAGGAIMMPGTLSLITQAFPVAQRGLAIGIWGGVSGLGLIAGPLLGGLLVSSSGDWRWIFLVNVPVGLVGFVMTRLYVRESRDEDAPRIIDWPGLATFSTGLLLLMLALSFGNDRGWTSPTILGAFVGGVALLGAFVAIEGRVRAPLIDLQLFRSGTFVAACLAAFLFSATVFGGQPFLSLFMQNYWEFSPLEGGLAFIPATFLVAVLMPVSGIIGQRLGSRLRLLLVFASLLVLVSALLLLRMDTESGYVDGLLPSFLIRGLGIGLFMSTSSFAVVSAVPLAKSGLASGTLAMSRSVGTSIGVALLGGVYLTSVHDTLPPELATLPPDEAAAVLGSSEHFVVAGGTEAVRAASEAAILDGFIALTAVTVVLGTIAAVASFFIRYRPPLPVVEAQATVDDARSSVLVAAAAVAEAAGETG